MLVRTLKIEDLDIYRDDINQCYSDNPQVTDIQNPLNFSKEDERIRFLESYIRDIESFVDGIFDDEQEYLYGIIIYEGIRLTNDGNSAQVHILISRDMWGKNYLDVYKELINSSMFDVLYAMIPSCCRGATTLCKRLGFKKTGYVPKALPYKNIKGEVKMFDELIYSLQKE